MPLLSIITVNLNNLAGLQKTMQSVFEQTFTDYEYIIIDGGSTDGSREYIEHHKEKLAYWVSERDEGVYDAMNKGIEESKGEYLMFLNSGDYLLSTQILQQSFRKYILQRYEDIYYGCIELSNHSKQKVVQCYPNNLDLEFWRITTINHQASFIKKNLFDELGFYSKEYSLASDYEMYLKAFISGKVFKYLNYAIVNYDITGVSSSMNDKYKAEMNLIWEKIVPEYLKKKVESNTKLRKRMYLRFTEFANKVSAFLKMRKK